MLKSIRRKLQGTAEQPFNIDNYEIVMELLQQGDLTKGELDFLMKHFADLKFFDEQRQRLPLYLYTQLFKNLNYLQVNAYNTVFEYGDNGQIFYIILKGEVCVLLPNPKIEEDIFNQKIESNTERKRSFSDFNDYLSITYPNFVKVRTLSSGETFGDLALITKSKRTATIVCSVDCHFMTLHKSAFDRILYEHHNSIHKQQLAFYDNIPYLHGIPDQHLTSLMHQMIEIQPKLNDTIYKEHEDSHSVYFIINGEVELSYQINARQRIVISLMTRGAIFGENEVLKGIPRTQKATCKSNETIIKTLSSKQFLSTLDVHNLMNDCHQKSNQLAKRQFKQIIQRRKATETLLVCRPPSIQVSGLDSEITRFHSTKQISLTHRHRRDNFARNHPITNTNCLIPIEIPHYIRLMPQATVIAPSLQTYSNRLRNLLKTERSMDAQQINGTSSFSLQQSPKHCINIHMNRLRKSRQR